MSIHTPVAAGDSSFNDFMAAFVGLVERFTAPAAPVADKPADDLATCPVWCVGEGSQLVGRHHVSDDGSYICHGSENAVLPSVSSVELPGDPMLLRAELTVLHENGVRDLPSLYIEGGGTVELTDATADEFIDGAQAWVDQLREMRKHLRQNQSGAWVPTLDHARQISRRVLERATTAEEDPVTGYAELVGDLEVHLRMLLDALDAEQPTGGGAA